MRALQLLLLSVLGLREYYYFFFSLFGWFLSNGSAAIVTIVQDWGHNPPLAHPRRMVGEVPSKGEGIAGQHAPFAGTMPIQMIGRYSRDSVNITIKRRRHAPEELHTLNTAVIVNNCKLLHGSNSTPTQSVIYQPYIHQADSGEKIGVRPSFSTARHTSLSG